MINLCVLLYQSDIWLQNVDKLLHNVHPNLSRKLLPVTLTNDLDLDWSRWASITSIYVKSCYRSKVSVRRLMQWKDCTTWSSLSAMRL